MTSPVAAAAPGAAAGATLSRRLLLATTAAATLATAVSGCTTDDRPPPPPQPPEPDESLLLRVRAAERQLVRLYDATIARHPELSATLASIRAQHVAHLDALGSGRIPDAGTDAVPSVPDSSSAGSRLPDPATAAPSATPVQPPGPQVPESPAAAIAALQATERAAAAARLSDCLRVSSAGGDLAALLASIGASEAAHAVAIAPGAA